MKKMLSATVAAVLTASMSLPVFAILTPDGEPVIQDDIMLLDGAEQDPTILLPGPVETDPVYMKQSVTVTGVEDMTDDGVTYKNGLVSFDGGKISLTGTKIFDINGDAKTTADVKAGDVLITFTKTFSSANMPNYAVITSEDVYRNVELDGFTVSDTLGEYVDSQNFLAINVSEDTAIVDIDGNKLTEEDVADKFLMVFYETVTMSIPGITNPSKIIVLDAYSPIAVPTDEPAGPEYLYEFVVDGADAITDENGVILIPVRKYAEGLGFEVGWNDEDKSVTVGTVPMGVSFKIGENSYSKARMTPFVLETAPQLIDGLTYVPVSFFEQVIEAGVKIAK